MIPMSRRNKTVDYESLLKALFGRKTTQGRINKVIDAFFGDDLKTDTALHFINEVVIFKKPDAFIKNFKKYTVKPRLKKLIDEKL